MRIPALIFALSAVIVAFSCHKPQDSELESYLNSIRQLGMTVEARDILVGIASVRAQQSGVRFVREEASNMYSTNFTSLACPRPGIDSITLAKSRARSDSVIQIQLNMLRPIVDSDKSGFVSTKEANDFSELYYLLLLAQHIATVEHGQERDFMNAKSLNTEKLLSLKAKCLELHTRASNLQISGIPDWPFQ